MNSTTEQTVSITADPEVPAIRMTRRFAATPAQLLRAHTDPELFARWVGPDGLTAHIEHWDARTGGSWRYLARSTDGQEYRFHGCFHEVRADRMVQTFTFDGWPDAVTLETLTFADRDAMSESGMETGVTQGYAKLDRLIEAGPGT